MPSSLKPRHIVLLAIVGALAAYLYKESIAKNQSSGDDSFPLWGQIVVLTSALLLIYKFADICLPKPIVREQRVLVKYQTGKQAFFQVKNNTKVSEMIKQACDAEKIPPYKGKPDGRLVFFGRQLDGERTLEEYGINNDATLYLNKPLRGD